MDITKSNIFHRWEMLTNPHFSEVPEMTKLDFTEVVDHTMLIDLVNDGRPFTDDEIEQCRQRVMRFCQDQHKNRN